MCQGEIKLLLPAANARTFCPIQKARKVDFDIWYITICFVCYSKVFNNSYCYSSSLLLKVLNTILSCNLFATEFIKKLK